MNNLRFAGMDKYLYCISFLVHFLQQNLDGHQLSESETVTEASVFDDPSFQHQDKYAPRLWGGNATTIENHPYNVAITDTNTNYVICTGAIIGIKWILTSGHCLRNKMTVYVGGNVVGAGIRHNVKRGYRHPQFTQNGNVTHYDYLLLELDNNLEYWHKVKPIELGKQEDIVDNQHLTLTGYGQQNKSPGTEDPLIFEMNIRIMSDEICTNMYPVKSLREGEFCASDFGEGKAACPGDSGGPAVFNNTLLGFVVRGLGCGRMTDGLVILASVPFIKEWLLDIVLQS